MRKIKFFAAHFLLAGFLLCSEAFAAPNSDITALKEELQNIKNSYEKRISDLEKQLEKTNAKVENTNNKVEKVTIETAKNNVENKKTSDVIDWDEAKIKADRNRTILNSSFNPSMGVILNGRYSNFSNKNSGIAGFGIGEEGERGKEGFSLDESELNFSSNIDDKFFGSLTASIVNENNEDGIELEEAYIKTTAGLGLPSGLSVKAGRAFWSLGYLNERHAHTDDFADRPLPYRAFLNNGFNDDGAEVSYILPTSFYSEVGVGAFRGDDFPYGKSENGNSAYSAYGRIGGDIGEKQSWRFGLNLLSGKAKARDANEDVLQFIGNSDLYIADLKYNFAPTGNSHNQEITLQGEYFLRDEKGTYEDFDLGSAATDFNGKSKGWYLQSVYKFKPQWRVGARYSELKAANAPEALIGSIIDAQGQNPKTISAMIDWSNSEFSRVRLQYNKEKLSLGQDDNQVILQYIMSFGAHAAHNY